MSDVWERMPTLDEFLAHGHAGLALPRSRYVHHRDFASLYVRVGPRYIRTTEPPVVSDGARLNPVVTVANVTAHKPGEGAFTRLLDELRAKYPRWPVIVECVLSERLGSFLVRRGFKRIADGSSVGSGGASSFVLLGDQK